MLITPSFPIVRGLLQYPAHRLIYLTLTIFDLWHFLLYVFHPFCQRSKKVKFSFCEDKNTYYLLFSLSYCFFYAFCSFFIPRLTLWLIIQAKTSPKALCTVNFTPPLLLFRESLKVKFFLKGQIFLTFILTKIYCMPKRRKILTQALPFT